MSRRGSPFLSLGVILVGGALAGCDATPAWVVDAGTDIGRDARRDVPRDRGFDAGPPRCGEGIDSDLDSVPNDIECTRGTDPFNPDTDGDGLRDGQEIYSPGICVAEDRTHQRRPPPACGHSWDPPCDSGETCRSLDPQNRDTDGDGLEDGREDPNGDGEIDSTRGETDPRLWDTDGDGRNDSESGIVICRREGLVEPLRRNVPTGDVQVAFDPAWTMSPRTVAGTDRGAVLLDDPSTAVAALVVQRPSTFDIRGEADQAEASVVTALGATPVLVGQSITTHEMHAAVNSLYRVAAMGDPGTLRDRLVMPLVGQPAPAGTPTFTTTSNFYVEITTILRVDTHRTTVLVGISPSADFDDPLRATSTRVRDLTNTSGIANGDRTLDFGCQRIVSEGSMMADFLWLVDTSGSMGDDQERLGRTATRFFEGLTTAGVDFRVGVFEADSSTLNLETPGFRWIQGTDPMGATRLCEEVTSMSLGRCPTSTTDTVSPYRFTPATNTEEPLSAGVIAYETFAARVMMGETNPDRRFRDGAQVVAFFVTDEPGSNDDGRYFSRNTTRWGLDYPTRLGRVIEFYRDNNIRTFGLVNDFHTDCAMPNIQDMPRCVILGNGGSFIPIMTATDPEVASAMPRIVESVAGAASEYRLERTPISCTLQVRVRSMVVPRSRADGFDYDPANRTITFYGRTYRPRRGEEVVISYRVWAGSLG